MRPSTVRKKPPTKIVFIFVGSLFICLGFFIVHCQYLWMPYLTQKSLEVSQKIGLTVKQVFVRGRLTTPKDLLMQAIDIKKGDFLFKKNPWVIQEALQNIPWVEKVDVKRSLCGFFSIHLKERQPVVIWQFQKKHFLVDIHGVVIQEKPVGSPLFLPFIVGKDAPSKIPEILGVLKNFPSLSPQIEAFVRISGRRWDLKLKNGILLKLPETNVLEALLRLQRITDKISWGQATIIDLRLPQKTVVTLKKETQNI